MRWHWMPPAAVAARIARTLLAEPDDRSDRPPRTFPLARFQEAAVRRARRILDRRGGVIVADEVGLGKTYVALALIEEALRSGEAVAVVIPASLRSTWAPLVRRVGRSVGEGAASVYVTTHARLSRGTHDAARLAGAGLVVVDEAHGFRNPATRRYRALAERGPSSRLVLITATPVNNRVGDLYHLVRQFARDDAFRDLGVASLRACFLAPDGGGEDATRVAREVVVRRTRAGVSDGREASRPDAAAVRFPRRAPAEVIRYDDPCVEALVAGIEALELAPYSGADGAGSDSGGVEALLRLGLLKRLESGRPALATSLRRLGGLLLAFADAAGRGRLLRPSDPLARGGASDGDAIQLVLEAMVLETAAPAVDLERLATSARRDAARVRRMLETIRNGDPKLEALRAWLGGRPAGRKTVVFTEFRDTARSLWRALTPTRRVGRVDGSGAWLGERPAGRRAVVERFAPASSGARPPPDRERVDLLIATDVLSEGLNLQDADTVIAYDLPWNPVRLLQRIGRVDRLGSPHEVVLPVLFVPGAGLDDVLRLTRSLRSKLGGIAETLGAGDAGDLLARLGGADASRALERLAPADPWERLRAAVARLAERGGEPEATGLAGPANPLLGVVGTIRAGGRSGSPGPGAWLVLARAAGGRPALMEVRDAEGDVRDAGPDAAAALVRALENRGCGPPRDARRAGLEHRATAVARRVRRHLNARASAGRAPARVERYGPAARVAVRIRSALQALGPEPDPGLLARADLALRRLSRPLDLPHSEALARVLDQADEAAGGPRDTPSLQDLITPLEAILPAVHVQGMEAPSGLAHPAPEKAPVAVLAALRIPVPADLQEALTPVDGGGSPG